MTCSTARARLVLTRIGLADAQLARLVALLAACLLATLSVTSAALANTAAAGYVYDAAPASSVASKAWSSTSTTPPPSIAVATATGRSGSIALREPTRTPPRNALAAEGAATVSLFKAPASGLGARQFAEGYSAADFPGNGAYFAREKSIADSFAYHYGEGVIETHVPADVYAEHFAQHEMPFLGQPPGTELAIPPSKLGLLSQFPRTWHGEP